MIVKRNRKDIEQKVKDIIWNYFNEEVDFNTRFKEDLGVDSLDLIELTMEFEKEFQLDEVSRQALKNIKIVGDVVDIIVKSK